MVSKSKDVVSFLIHHLKKFIRLSGKTSVLDLGERLPAAIVFIRGWKPLPQVSSKAT
jgi:hypothetical protein